MPGLLFRVAEKTPGLRAIRSQAESSVLLDAIVVTVVFVVKGNRSYLSGRLRIHVSLIRRRCSIALKRR